MHTPNEYFLEHLEKKGWDQAYIKIAAMTEYFRFSSDYEQRASETHTFAICSIFYVQSHHIKK